MKRLNFPFPAWLVALSVTQGSALLVFMSFAGALPLIQADWGITNVQAGAIQSAGGIGYILAVLVASSLTDFIPPQRLIVIGAFWAGAANLLFAFFAHDTTSAVILRALVGFGIAGIYTPGVKLISSHVAQAERGRAIGFFIAFFTLGTAVSIAISGSLSALLGWRAAFGATTVGPLIGTLIAWRSLPVPAQAERTDLPQGRITDLLGNPTAMGVILIYACHTWEVLGLRSWLAAYLTDIQARSGVELAVATTVGAAVAGLATIVAAFATATIGAASDRLGRMIVIRIAMSLGLVFLLLLGAAAASPWAVVVGLSLLASFVSNADSAAISSQLTEVVPQETLGRTLAVFSFLGFSAGSISPLVFGAALDHARSNPAAFFQSPWAPAFASLAAASLVGLAVATGVKRMIR